MYIYVCVCSLLISLHGWCLSETVYNKNRNATKESAMNWKIKINVSEKEFWHQLPAQNHFGTITHHFRA